MPAPSPTAPAQPAGVTLGNPVPHPRTAPGSDIRVSDVGAPTTKGCAVGIGLMLVGTVSG